MKNFIQILLKNKSFFTIITFTLVLSSCSSYQTAMNDNDGIYDTGNNLQTKDVVKPQKEATVATNKTKPVSTLKYETYFKNKAEKIKVETDEIFTDVDSYSSSDIDEELLDKDVTDFSTNNPSWEDSGETVVNIYNYPTYRPYYYGWYRPYRPYYSGLYININPWWNTGYEYYLTGYDYYNPYYSPYYYGGFYGSYYSNFYNPYFYNPYRYYNYRYGRRNTSRNYTSTNRNSVRRNIQRSQNANSTRTSTRNTIRRNTRSNNNVRSDNTRMQHNSPRTSTPRIRSNNTHSVPRTKTRTKKARSYSTPVRRSNSNNYSNSNRSSSSRINRSSPRRR